MKRHLPVNKQNHPVNINPPCKANIPPLYGNSEEFPENAILEGDSFLHHRCLKSPCSYGLKFDNYIS